MKKEAEYKTLCSAAREMAVLGGGMARGFFGRVTAVSKGDDTPVTEADHVIQAAILDFLADRFPSHAVIAEEEISAPDRHAAIASSEYCWVVDPIDGTRNFVREVPVYSSSVGVLHHGRPVAGAIYDAMSGDVYTATVGEGAFCGDRRLAMEGRPLGSDSVVAVSSIRLHAVPLAAREWQKCIAYRNYGSLCLHLAWVADGKLDAAYALECKLWDIAVGSLLVEESGGKVTGADGGAVWPVDLASYHGEDIPVLVGYREMHGRLLDSLCLDGDVECA